LPRITVIIPTYNWSSVLPFSIGSVLRQTYTDFELLVIGDGCTDDSASVVGAIGDPRVRWFNLPTNAGHQSAANNEGLRQARGELIAYLGHDDLWLPHHLSTLVAAIDSGADMAYGIIIMVRPDGSTEAAPNRLAGYARGLWIPPSAVLHRRQAALDAGGWPLFADVDCDPELALWERMQAAGSRMQFVRRLTAIKFPAAMRRNVYQTRSVHEQQTWSTRIATESDLEAVELVKLLSNYVDAPSAGKPFRKVLREFAGEVSSRLRFHLLGPTPPPKTPPRAEVFNARRKFKGLEPKDPPRHS
jgi:glycosyltransferase involved in cell wall biosynthesis